MDVYTTEEIADMIKMTPSMVRQLIRTKKLRALKINSEYRVLKEDFEKFVAENMTM